MRAEYKLIHKARAYWKIAAIAESIGEHEEVYKRVEMYENVKSILAEYYNIELITEPNKVRVKAVKKESE